MADLPPSRLRLYQPAFYSTGVDCFGPYLVKIGRRTEKRWWIVFKCMTTRAVHIDLLSHLDTDSFLMALRRFIARRGKPFELLSDQGTNFRGSDRELREAFVALAPDLQTQLGPQQIWWRFNPPHFGGCWEREIQSVKQALQVILGAQSVMEEVVEIEGILNSNPLGFASTDIADPDPVTPNTLLIGHQDASLPQVVYPSSERLSSKRWRHSQLLADHFWKHFIRFYLPGLQAWQKWNTENPDLQPGKTVHVVDPQFPRSLWPVGKVVGVTPGGDGKVRSAEVRVGGENLHLPCRPVHPTPSYPRIDTTLRQGTVEGLLFFGCTDFLQKCHFLQKSGGGCKKGCPGGDPAPEVSGDLPRSLHADGGGIESRLRVSYTVRCSSAGSATSGTG